jgi:phosphate:Na+ symporter
VSLEHAVRLLGGVGLFLLGMRLMTEGLKSAVGEALRGVLARSTRTPLRGIAAGALVTSLVQSSSAVTVATIGFVNAGLLSLSQALAITYGSNVGTTMTAWLVATVGFHLDLGALSLPLVGVGMGLRLFVPHGRLGSFGEALAGFGIFFLGIDALRTGFEGLGGQVELASLAAGPLHVPLFVVLGFVLTLLMQSSSAALAIVLTATAGGVVSLGSGAALVIGANVGTTSTAALASIGATPNAKRVAVGHVAFNVTTGAVALLLLPLLLFGIVRGRAALSLDAEPAAVLAGFHTLFNLLGVALMWPLTGRLVRSLEARFRTHEEDEARPRFLDRNVLSTPYLALDAMVMELARAGQITRRLAGASLAGDRRARGGIAAGQRSLAFLIEAIGEYIQRLQRTVLPAELDPLLPTALRVSRYYAETAELAGMVAAGGALRAACDDPRLEQEVQRFVAGVRRFVEETGVERPEFQVADLASQTAALEEQYHALKASLLEAGSRGALSVPALVQTLDWLSNVRRLLEQSERAARFLASLLTRKEDTNDHESNGGEETADAPAAQRAPAAHE